MQNKNYKEIIREDKRRAAHERIGAVGLALVTLAGVATIAKEGRTFAREVNVNPAVVFNQISERENETARIPVRFDIGIHTPAIGGL